MANERGLFEDDRLPVVNKPFMVREVIDITVPLESGERARLWAGASHPVRSTELRPGNYRVASWNARTGKAVDLDKMPREAIDGELLARNYVEGGPEVIYVQHIPAEECVGQGAFKFE
jgi:hypothetical protein